MSCAISLVQNNNSTIRKGSKLISLGFIIFSLLASIWYILAVNLNVNITVDKAQQNARQAQQVEIETTTNAETKIN